MSEDKERLTRVETELGFLKNAFGEVKTALLQLAGDMHVLAIANAERTEDRRAIDRISAEVKAVESEIRRLNARTDEIIAACAAAEQKRAEDALREERAIYAEGRKEKNKWGWELIRTSIAVSAAALLYHFGIHPL
jgi:uncharacterized protein (DUF58 family)